ncbi:hypothetical protein [Nocardiopsis sp. NRRL B-16309]|uniref:hypothetical protein n=1 Tax=Nocardiopsis sp. NRRL B-16309 TaxID=1519494 RepID=UPI0006B03D96|nr:hypothetical protein [Nocardiopsis sp. NRRL B-16309]KOX17718.1 hypothetical protein ADL05_08780 [Nocardiopsis sp. NRRL B-16309]
MLSSWSIHPVALPALAGLFLALSLEFRRIARDRGEDWREDVPLRLRQTLVASTMGWSYARWWLASGGVLLVLVQSEEVTSADLALCLPVLMWGLAGTPGGQLDMYRRGRDPDRRLDPRHPEAPRPRPRTVRNRPVTIAGCLIVAVLLWCTFWLGAQMPHDAESAADWVRALGILVVLVALSWIGGQVLGASLFSWVRLDGTHVTVQGGGQRLSIPVELIAEVRSDRGVRVRLADGRESSVLLPRGPAAGERQAAERIRAFADEVRSTLPEGPLYRDTVTHPGPDKGLWQVWLGVSLYLLSPM